ncbi:MOSC domain-containing protein [Congregibacter variabilis]|uniref:MOSC domain-containing protein n=1 Tax=Congregibacter variabilis TaxID=3081200 RepID=A0ABZ0HZT2_9GAMM|nr:MOSC domain-containing protein [Congregibacter sp. IMCC43200]
MDLSAIYRYPIKSARGHSLEAAVIDRFGVSGDRRWMLIDSAGLFYSQRRLPQMALLEVASIVGGLRLSFGGESIQLEIPGAQQNEVSATVWEHTMLARCADDRVNTWLSECLGEDLRLVFFPQDANRPVDADYLPDAQQEQHVGFADGFPLLIITQASLDDLNTRLPAPVPMDRFRPNLVIRGAQPYAEDSWRQLRVGSTTLAIVKPCSRCAIPAINQQTAEQDPDINRVLAGYRRQDGVIYFGMNAVVTAGEDFAVGDVVEVLE